MVINSKYLEAGDRLEKIAGSFGDHKELDSAFVGLIDETMMVVYSKLALEAEEVPDFVTALWGEELFRVIARAMAFGYSLAIVKSREPK